MDDIRPFKSRLAREVLSHPSSSRIPTPPGSSAAILAEQARAFLIHSPCSRTSFSSAQLQKVLNAETLEEMRASKSLANEIGVGFQGRASPGRRGPRQHGGEIESGTFTSGSAFRAAGPDDGSVRLDFQSSASDAGGRRRRCCSAMSSCGCMPMRITLPLRPLPGPSRIGRPPAFGTS